MQTNTKQLFLFLCLSFLGFLFFSAASFFLPLPELKSQVWKGYHTILIEEKNSLSQVEAAFLSSGFEEVIHYNNVLVEYFDFAGLNSIKLSEVSDRFEKLDPRVDSYLQNLPRYFFTGEGGEIYSILYVKEKENRLKSIIGSIQVLKGLSLNWRFADVKPLLTVILLCLYAIILLIILMADRTRWLYLLAAGLPWVVFIFLGGFFEFLSASLIVVTFAVFFRNYRPVFRFFLNHGYIDGGSRKAGFSLILLAMAVLAALILQLSSKPELWLILRFVCSLLSMGFLFFCFNVASAYRRKRQEHRLFFRVPLAERRNLMWIYQFCIITILLLSPAAVKIQGFDQSPPVPVPLVLGDFHNFSAETFAEMDAIKMRSLKAGAGEEALPDIADYFTHRAYQECFFLGRSYLFPQVGERVGVSSFSNGGDGGIEKNFQEMIVFSEDWFNRILEKEEPRGLLGLWLSQENPVGSVVASPVHFTISGLFLFRHLFLCLIIFVPMGFLNYHLTPQLMYGIKSLMLRRKRQAA